MVKKLKPCLVSQMPEISYMVFNIGTGINEEISERINDSASGCISH